MSVRKLHTSEIRAAHPYLKKSWVPPRVYLTGVVLKYHFSAWYADSKGYANWKHETVNFKRSTHEIYILQTVH